MFDQRLDHKQFAATCRQLFAKKRSDVIVAADGFGMFEFGVEVVEEAVDTSDGDPVVAVDG